MKSEQYTTTLDPDIAERVNEFKESRGLNKSAAVERLLVRQVRAMEAEDEEAREEPDNGWFGDIRLIILCLIAASAVSAPVGVVAYYSATTGNFPGAEAYLFVVPISLLWGLSAIFLTIIASWAAQRNDEQHAEAPVTPDGV